MTDPITVPKTAMRVDIRSVILVGVVTFGCGWYLAMQQAGTFEVPAINTAAVQAVEPAPAGK